MSLIPQFWVRGWTSCDDEPGGDVEGRAFWFEWLGFVVELCFGRRGR
jgi:hypothetical protein